MSRHLALFALAILLLVPSGATAADSSLWLHVRVDERDDVKVAVNLPLSLIDKALPMIDYGGHFDDRSVRLGRSRLTYPELRDLWLELRDGPDMEYVTVEDGDETVRVWKEGGFLFVRVRDRREESVDVRMPLGVVDALLGHADTFDFEGAVAALAEQGEGELVAVDGRDETVRVWVDRTAEPAGR